MKEVTALNQKLAAHFGTPLPEEGFDFSRVESSKNLGRLPPDLRAEAEALRTSLNALIPEPFEYYVFLLGDEGPAFGLEYDRMPVGPLSENLDPERSLLEHVREFDWDAARQDAAVKKEQMDDIVRGIDRLYKPLPSAKAILRSFQEDARDFVKEKRRDAGKIHVLTWDAKEELMEYEYESGEALRGVLPDLLRGGVEVVAVVAHGKPLTVKSIDALKAGAQQVLRERLRFNFQEADEDEDEEGGETEGEANVIDVEAEVTAAAPPPPAIG